jgi:hypothetical protein
VSTPIFNALLRPFLKDLNPAKNVLNIAVKLPENPVPKLFKMPRSMRKHFFILNVPKGKKFELSNPVTVEAEKHPQTWR